MYTEMLNVSHSFFTKEITEFLNSNGDI